MNDDRGDIMDKKYSNPTRLYPQHIWGLPHYDNHKIKSLTVNRVKHLIDLRYVVEPNLNWRSHNVYTNYKSTIKNQFNSGPITSTSTNTDILRHKVYQPGGFLIAVMNPSNFRIELNQPNQKLGQWTSISFLDGEKIKLSIVNTYRVYKNNIETSGLSTKYY